MLTRIAQARAIRPKAVLVVGLLATIPVAASNVSGHRGSPTAAAAATPPHVVGNPVEERRRADFAAMRRFRPGYPFWQHVFTLHDGAIAYGSAADGRLLATFPAKGDWTRQAVWVDPSLAHVLDDEMLAKKVKDRREQVEALLEQAAGPIVNNSTRGDALLPNVHRYGGFLGEWGAIYARFGVPPEIGLAQVILESGLSPTRRSEANAVGFCQWLQKNWRRLNDFSPTPIEGTNQTTQAPYCAAYLSVLATKYGSFIPALSEHNAGGTNVGRTLISGEYLGAEDVRVRYLLGSKLAHDLRTLPDKEFKDVYNSYGPRSYLYAEMVFGNTLIVKQLLTSIPQEPIHAMRVPRAITIQEIVKRTGLSIDEVRRFNPALKDRVKEQGMLYLPRYVADFGADVAFWRRPMNASFAAVLDDFLRLEPGPERWDDPAFASVLSTFKQRFIESNTEEGRVMATVLTYTMDQAYTSGRRALIAEFRSSDEVRRLIDLGVRRRSHETD